MAVGWDFASIFSQTKSFQLWTLLVLLATLVAVDSQSAFVATTGPSFVSVLESSLFGTSNESLISLASDISLANASWVPQQLSQGKRLTVESPARAVLDARMKGYLVTAVAGNATLEVRNLVLVNL
jgi:hypothetical protein